MINYDNYQNVKGDVYDIEEEKEEERPRKNTDSTVESCENYESYAEGQIVSFDHTIDQHQGEELDSIRLENAFCQLVTSAQPLDEDSSSIKEMEERTLSQSLFTKWFHAIPTLVLTTIGWVFLFIVGFDWPAQQRSVCFEVYLTYPECMCEELRANAIIAQPVNTYSNCIFSFGAIFIAFCADTKRFPSNDWWENNINLITRKRYFSLSYCIVLTNIGYSSALFHARWVEWAGTLDVVGIFVIFIWLDSFIICKFLLKWKGCSDERISRITNIHRKVFPVTTALLYSIWFTTKIPTFIQDIILFCSAAATIPEILCFYQYCRREKMTQALIFIMTIITFIVGFMIQRISKSGSPLCDPTSYLQGHGAWHVLSGLAATMLFFFFLGDSFV